MKDPKHSFTGEQLQSVIEEERKEEEKISKFHSSLIDNMIDRNEFNEVKGQCKTPRRGKQNYHCQSYCPDQIINEVAELEDLKPQKKVNRVLSMLHIENDKMLSQKLDEFGMRK